MFAVRKSIFLVSAILASLAIGAATGFWIAGQRVGDQIVSSYEGETFSYTKGIDSIDSVEKMVTDENGDGLIDDLSIHISYPELSTAMYHIADLTFDGIPNRIALSMDDGMSLIALMDHDRDGSMDWWAIALQSRTKEGASFRYFDLNLDGKLDIMSKYVDDIGKEYYVRMENTWTRAGRTSSEPREIAKIRIDGEPVDVEFEDGEWALVEPM